MSSWWWRWWWVALGVLVILGFLRLRFDVDVLNLLPPDEPSVRGLKLYQEHFTNSRELIIALRAPEPERAEELARRLAERLRQETNLVAEASWEEPWKEHPEQLAELLACIWLNQPPDQFQSLTNRLAPGSAEATLQETKAVLTTSLSPIDIARRAFDPYNLLDLPALNRLIDGQGGEKMFASPAGDFRVVFVQARSELPGYQECSTWLAEVRQRVEQLRAEGEGWTGVSVRYTGRPVFVSEIAGGMRRSLSGSITGTTVIIALLFWLTHRRLLPMLWLLALLALVLFATIALGGLILGKVSVLSLGFAAVLLGLAVDYAVVHYQEALSHPHLSVPEIRRAIAPSIFWAAITTICAFLVLNLGGLPGLAQLGSLVAIGVALAAVVMVMIYLPPLFPDRRGKGAQQAVPRRPVGRVSNPSHYWRDYFFAPVEPATTPQAAETETSGGRAGLWTTGLVIAATIGLVLIFGLPPLDKTANALRFARGEAEEVLEEVTASMGIPRDPLWIIISGRSEAEVARRLSHAENLLTPAVSNGVIGGYLLASPLWPQPDFQQVNQPVARWLATQGPRLRETALREGFNADALALTEKLFEFWAQPRPEGVVVWPTNEASQSILKRFVARTENQWLTMGLVYPATNSPSGSLAALSTGLAQDSILISGWQLLGGQTLKRVRSKTWQLILPMVLLVGLSLWLAFRRGAEILLGGAVLLLSGLCLLAVMAMAGWSWNLLNLMAVPLILGTGVDYGIFMQLGLRRHGGDVRVVRRSIGRALLLCGGTAIAGFGSLAWSGSPGMASLGKVCAVGIAANMLIAIFLLPSWWRRICAGSTVEKAKTADRPSSFYRAWLWRLGLRLVRVLPLWVLKQICLLIAELYFRLHRTRREIVVGNLLPALQNDRAAAEKMAHALFRQFAFKLVELWRFESGHAVESWFTAGVDWGILESAAKRGKGVLLVTPHLGNWEIGGPLLAKLGFKLLVLTQAEPGEGLTELRIQSRSRWGIETLLVGSGGFDFIEIIRRLQDGATVALLIDRPPAAKAVPVKLFGRPFGASIAAAELARASGCALLGVVVVRCGEGYAARILSEFQYDRRALGNREARQKLTQQIISAFEPEIRQHLDQWYHFVPIWPKAPESGSDPAPDPESGSR